MPSVSNTSSPFVDLRLSLSLVVLKFHRMFFLLTQLIEFIKRKVTSWILNVVCWRMSVSLTLTYWHSLNWRLYWYIINQHVTDGTGMNWNEIGFNGDLKNACAVQFIITDSFLWYDVACRFWTPFPWENDFIAMLINRNEYVVMYNLRLLKQN